MKRTAIGFVLFGFSTIAAAAGSWREVELFPGFDRLLDMLVFAFWWEFVFVVAAVPILLFVVVPIVAIFKAIPDS
jgi:hypothetical protein